MSTDYDSPWKEALDAYFEPFLALLFPEVHRQVDWSRGHEPLDKELQQVVREAEVGGATSISWSRSGRRTAPSAGC
jgi:hypothetical protein